MIEPKARSGIPEAHAQEIQTAFENFAAPWLRGIEKIPSKDFVVYPEDLFVVLKKGEEIERRYYSSFQRPGGEIEFFRFMNISIRYGNVAISKQGPTHHIGPLSFWGEYELLIINNTNDLSSLSLQYDVTEKGDKELLPVGPTRRLHLAYGQSGLGRAVLADVLFGNHSIVLLDTEGAFSESLTTSLREFLAREFTETINGCVVRTVYDPSNHRFQIVIFNQEGKPYRKWLIPAEVDLESIYGDLFVQSLIENPTQPPNGTAQSLGDFWRKVNLRRLIGISRIELASLEE